MARIDERLNDCVSQQFTGGPRFKTNTVLMDSGDEVRNRRWVYPKHEYSAQFLNFNEADRDDIIAMQHVAAGSWLDFRFKDWMDFTATDETLAPVVGTTTPVQLIKTYTKGAFTSQRIIQAVLTATIYRNGVAVAGTLDDELGTFVPNFVWVAGTFMWSGTFDVWVHFTEDYNPFSATDLHHWTAPILLEESRQR